MINETKLAEIVGPENLDFSDATLAEYASDMSFVPKVRPKCVLWPRQVEDIQKIVQLARETVTPIIPISSGPPHFRGDTIPSTGGGIIMNLSRMKKIIHISRKHRSVMFEPGVTFEDLIPAVASEGLRLNLPLMPRQSKSVLGSILEREPVIMPKYHWDIADPLGCTEVVFGTGDLTRTGAAAGSGSIEEQWSAGGGQKEAAGPSSASWYRVIQGAQGTMGVVSWASARCEIIPQIEEPYLIGASQLDPLLEAVHWLIRRRLVNECLILNSTNLARIITDNPSEIRRLKVELPTWILFFNIAAYEYFPEERIEGQTADMQQIMQRIGLPVVKVLNRIKASAMLKRLSATSPEPYWKIRETGGCQDIFFITVKNRLNQLIQTLFQESANSGYPSSDIGSYIQPIVQGVNYHCEFNLPYRPNVQEEVTRMRLLHTSAVKSLMANGAYFSRPYGEITPLIMNRDATTVDALKKVKKIIDPDNILNPGKLCF